MIPIRHYSNRTDNEPIENKTLTPAHSPQITKKTFRMSKLG